MQIIYFLGRFYPEPSTNIILQNEVTINMPSFNNPVKMNINIIGAQLTVVCELEEEKDLKLWIAEIRNYVEEFSLAPIDCLAFLIGRSSQLEIYQCIFPDENLLIPLSKSEAVSLENFSSLSQQDISDRIILPFNDTPLRLALANYKRAINDPGYTAMYCYKAIENIRAFFQNMETNAKKNDSKIREEAWKTLRDSLNIDETSLKELAHKSKFPRHGSVPYISGEERQKFMTFTREIIDRYIKFYLHIKKPLDKENHPLLVL